MILQTFIDSEVRTELNDLSKLIYSDYDIHHVCNNVFGIITNILIKYDSNILSTSQEVVLTNGIGTLPRNFISAVRVYANRTPNDQNSVELKQYEGYIIAKTRIYAAGWYSLDLQYRGYNADTQMADAVPFPEWMLEYIKKYVVMVLKKEVPSGDQRLMTMIENDIKYIVVSRENAYIDRELPFFV